MKTLTAFILCFACISTYAQQHQMEKIWETDSVMRVPESVLYDSGKDVLYVAMMDGQPGAADGKGGIAKLSPTGKIIDLNWISGLNAPKGMAIHGGKLYAADLTEVVVIDLNTNKIDRRIAVDSAKFLNDVTVDAKGVLYVSDSRTSKIHRIANNTVSDYLVDVKGVNGLRAIKNDLFILAGGSLLKADQQKKMVTIATGMEKSTDGIEPTLDGNYIVSCWSGNVYYVFANGKTELMLDTREQKINAADIGFNPAKNIIYVPTFFKNSVAAYQLK